MKFSILAEHLEKIEKTSSRLEITQLLADLYKNLSAEELHYTAYLLQGRVGPLFESIEFGMAERMVIRSIGKSMQIDVSDFDKRYKQIGDIGETLQKYKEEITSIEQYDLSIIEVFHELKKMAQSSGEGSQEVKMNILAYLVRVADPLTAKYVVRIPLGMLRLGFSDMTVLDAYSWMLTGDKKLRPLIEKAYHVRPDLGYIGRVLKEGEVQGIEHVKPALFTPILMMRAERLSSADDIIKKIGTCAIESKYDGFRVQVHFNKQSGEVRIYSRNLEDVSYMYPDLIEGVQKEVIANEIIFEGEAIGFDSQTGSFLPFQETVQRKRKHGIAEKAKEVPLKLFTYELLYAEGENYLEIPFHERRKQLEHFIQTTGDIHKDTLLVTEEHITDNAKEFEILFEDAIAKGLEGIMAKKLDGIYQAGARGWNWIKYKRSYSSQIDDTIDCLVMGYDFGKGKRVGFGIGAFLVGVYQEELDQYVTIAKIGTGLTDDEWRELQVKSETCRVKTKPSMYDVDKAMEVDVWIDPQIIVEIKADEISRSPVHTAGRIMKPSKSGNAFDIEVSGYALRFPRLTRFRDDRRPGDSTTLTELEDMFKNQKQPTKK
ncbi:MAG: ATP-dependent DNA ligase [Candidatus Roizmanbacteria bacterium]